MAQTLSMEFVPTARANEAIFDPVATAIFPLNFMKSPPFPVLYS